MKKVEVILILQMTQKKKKRVQKLSISSKSFKNIYHRNKKLLFTSQPYLQIVQKVSKSLKSSCNKAIWADPFQTLLKAQ